jgi:hypothetical protein
MKDGVKIKVTFILRKDTRQMAHFDFSDDGLETSPAPPNTPFLGAREQEARAAWLRHALDQEARHCDARRERARVATLAVRAVKALLARAPPRRLGNAAIRREMQTYEGGGEINYARLSAYDLATIIVNSFPGADAQIYEIELPGGSHTYGVEF